jgi:hypothetical protein
MAGFDENEWDMQDNLAIQRLEQIHSAARAKLSTEEERLAYDIGRALAETTDAALRIKRYALQSDRPFSEHEPIEAEILLEGIYQRLESGELSPDHANGLLKSMQSEYLERPINTSQAASVKRKRKTARASR